MDANKERLRESLRDKEYREQYADSTLVGDIAVQVQALRRQRGLSQEDLATRIGSKQPKISSIEAQGNGDRFPNWELGTLNRIARALGTRLKVRFETYGSLVEEYGTLTTDSLRLPDVADDPILFPRPAMPEPDPAAPERTRWMQAVMIPWLWEDRLDIPRLIDWLQGRGLPAVGHEEEPYVWLLRGISLKGEARDYLEKRFAERLAMVVGEQPDVHPIVESDGDEFLVNLYWTCAGLVRPGFLGESLWRAYQRQKGSKLAVAVRDALQGALVHNQFGETKPLKELWAPMVEKGRHYWLRGDETVGYEGILIRHRTVKADLGMVFWALGKISMLWSEGTADREERFKRLIDGTPELNNVDAVNRMIDYAGRGESGWAAWARALVEVELEPGPIQKMPPPVSGETETGPAWPIQRNNEQDLAACTLTLRQGPLVVSAEWKTGQPVRVFFNSRGSELAPLAEPWMAGKPRSSLFLNVILTDLGNAEYLPQEFGFNAKMLRAKAFRLVEEDRRQHLVNA